MKFTRIVKPLLESTKTDFRFVPFCIVSIYISLLFLSQLLFGSYSVLATYFRIHPIPYFVDLEILLCGVDAIRVGLNPYEAICFEGEAYFNYPYIWGFLSFFPFITSANHIYIGLILTVTFFVLIYKFIGKINFKSSIIYSLIFISPALMLGLERGNSDVIIFIILMLIPLLCYKSKLATSIIIVLASFLKLFPIGAIVSVLINFKEATKYKFFLFAVSCLSFVTYVFLFKDNIIQVSEKTPRPYKDASFGLGATPSFLIDFFEISDPKKWIVFVSFILFLMGFFLVFFRKIKYSNHDFQLNFDKKGIAFLMGSGIFIMTCVIGYNWEYRLIFLVFTVPQLIVWSNNNSPLAKIMIASYVLLLWSSLVIPILNLFIPYDLAYFLNYFLTIALFFILSVIYLKSIEIFLRNKYAGNSTTI